MRASRLTESGADMFGFEGRKALECVAKGGKWASARSRTPAPHPADSMQGSDLDPGQVRQWGKVRIVRWFERFVV